jgi:hypothetical protein
MTTVSAAPHGGKWTAVDVVARCAASVEVRPITIVGDVVAEPGSEFESKLRDFVSYGTPFESPYGAYNGEIDAPGGLGGRLENVKIVTLPVEDEDHGSSESRNLRAEILDPEGKVLGSVELDRVTRSQGADGVRVVFRRCMESSRSKIDTTSRAAPEVAFFNSETLPGRRYPTCTVSSTSYSTARRPTWVGSVREELLRNLA